MQVSIETTTGLERRLIISVPADQVDSKVDERLVKTSKDIRLKGFRPGKVPKNVVKTQFGSGIRQEVVGEVISSSFYEAVIQEKIEPAGQPVIDFKQNKSGKNLEYTATFEIVPEVAVGDLSKIAVERPTTEIDDAEVERMISLLRDQQGSWETVERAAADKDQVNVDYKGTKDGEAFEGGSAEASDLLLGSGRMIPGFEDGIIGMSAGEEKTLALSFPDDYHSEDLKGAAVEFVVTVNTVQERKIAELNDEFYEKFNVKGDEVAFKEEITKNMARELKQATERLVKQSVMDQLADIHEVQIPAPMLANEIKAMRDQMFQQFAGSGADFQPTADMLPDDLFKEQSEKRVALGLIVRGIITDQELSADGDRVKAEIDLMAAGYEKPEEVVNYYYSNEQLLQNVQSKVLEDQVIDHVLSLASVTEVSKTYEEIVQAAQAASQQ